MPKISDLSDIGNIKYWAGFFSTPCVVVPVRRAVWSVKLMPADWRRPGGDRE